MLRILKQALRDGANGLFHGAEPFSGVAYDKQSNGTVRPWIVENGLITRPYEPPYFPPHEDGVKINVADFMSEDEILYFDGKLFSGTAFEFNGDYCFHELFSINGNSVVDSYWAQNGELVRIGNTSEQLSEVFEWSPGEVFDVYSARTSNSFFGFLRFSTGGDLQGVGSHRGFWARAEHLMHDARIWLDKLPEDLFHRPFAENIELSGADIDDAFVSQAMESGRFSKSKNVSFISTGITPRALAMLEQLPNLNRVHIKEMDVAARQRFAEAAPYDGRVILDL